MRLSSNRFRFLKFGIVGASGSLINFAGFWMFQEHLFTWIGSQRLRINVSLVVAIILATFNNYCWNRWWTWKDRKAFFDKGFWIQMVEYYAICWAAILLQVVFTNLFFRFMHYLPANMIAIALTAVANFMVNDAWTFAVHRRGGKPAPWPDRLQTRAADCHPPD